MLDNQANKILKICADMVHIGKEIKRRAQELRMGPTELAKEISVSKQNIYHIFDRKTIDTGQLEVISKALRFDFFSLYRTVDDNQEQELSLLKNQNRILTDLIQKMQPPSKDAIVGRIILYESQTVTVLLKDRSSVFGTIYLNDKTGTKKDDLKGVIIVPVKAKDRFGDHIQSTYNSGDKDILEMISDGGVIPLNEIYDIIPKKYLYGEQG